MSRKNPGHFVFMSFIIITCSYKHYLVVLLKMVFNLFPYCRFCR